MQGPPQLDASALKDAPEVKESPGNLDLTLDEVLAKFFPSA